MRPCLVEPLWRIKPPQLVPRMPILTSSRPGTTPRRAGASESARLLEPTLNWKVPSKDSLLRCTLTPRTWAVFWLDTVWREDLRAQPCTLRQETSWAGARRALRPSPSPWRPRAAPAASWSGFCSFSAGSGRPQRVGQRRPRPLHPSREAASRTPRRTSQTLEGAQGAPGNPRSPGAPGAPKLVEFRSGDSSHWPSGGMG